MEVRAPYSYSWYDNNSQLISVNSNSYSLIDSIENLQASSYIVEITDDDNCTITDTFSVSEPSQLTMITSSIPTSATHILMDS